MRPKATVLAVEDLRLVAKDLQARLKRLGYQAAVASTGDEALRQVEQVRPDVVLMDIVLEGDLGGVEAARVIRERWGLPIIFLTAHADAETVRRAQAAGPADYVLKPFSDQDLDHAIARVLGLARDASPPPSARPHA
jgi:CheY-like chemotaxis protein